MTHSKHNFIGYYEVYGMQIKFTAPSLHDLAKQMKINYNTALRVEKNNGEILDKQRIPIRILKFPKDYDFVNSDCNGGSMQAQTV